MKKFVLILLCVFVSSCVYAQFDTSDFVRKKAPQKFYSVYKSNLLPLVSGSIPIITSEIRLIGEFVNSPKSSIQVGVSYLGKSIFMALTDTALSAYNQKSIVRGFRVQAEYRFFLSEPANSLAPEGYYFAPHLSYSKAILSTNLAIKYGYFYDFTNVNVLCILGKQMFFNRFALDVFGGIGYKNYTYYEVLGGPRTNIKNSPDTPPYMKRNFKVKIGFNIGFGKR